MKYIGIKGLIDDNKQGWTSTILDSLKDYAEKYEYNIYNQAVRLNISKSDSYYYDYFTSAGRLKKSNRSTDWKGELKNWLETYNYANYNNKDEKYLIKELENTQQQVNKWLYTTTDGKKFINDMGIQALIKEIKTGKWYNLKNGGLREGDKINNKEGLVDEAKYLLGLRDWMKRQDKNGVIIDTIDFEGRHQEGRFDILIKFSKAATFAGRRPIRIEGKSSLNNFVIGTMIDTLFNKAKLTIGKQGQLVIIFNRQVLQSIIDNYLSTKYTEGGEYSTSNILPIFLSGNDVMLFSEFIDKSKNNLFIGVDDEIKTYSYWGDLGYLQNQLHQGTQTTVDKIYKKKISTKLTYGKP